MEARRVKTRLKPGFQRQPTARSRRETADHWAANRQSQSMTDCAFFRTTLRAYEHSNVDFSNVCRRSGCLSKPMRDSRWLDVLARLCLRVIDSDSEHGKTLLEFFRARLGSVPGRKFGLESTIDFQRITGSRQITGNDHLIPFAQ
jgi:hypothetical protein